MSEKLRSTLVDRKVFWFGFRELSRETAVGGDRAVHEEAAGGEERPARPNEQVPALQRWLRRDQQALLGGGCPLLSAQASRESRPSCGKWREFGTRQSR